MTGGQTRRASFWHRWAGLAAVVAGLLVLAGWRLNIAALTNVLPGWPTMKPNTALAFVLAGASLWWLREEQPQDAWTRSRRLGFICALLAAGIGALTLAQYLGAWNLGIDQLLFENARAPGEAIPPSRMASATALGFLLVGAALALLHWGKRLFLAQSLLALMGFLIALPPIGYMYGTSSIHEFAPYSSVSIPSAILFGVLIVGALWARAEYGFMSTLMGAGIGAQSIRRLLPLTAMVVLAMGGLHAWGEKIGLFGAALGAAIFAVAAIAVLAVSIWRNAVQLTRTEDALVASEARLRALNESLEHTVSERVAALRETEQRFQATFEQANIGLAHVDLDGRWLRVNHKLCELVEYSEEELLARTFQDITHPDDLERDLNLVQRLLSGEIDSYSMEKRYIRKGGALIWILLTVSLVRHPAGEPNYFISAISDISQRKQAEQALAESEREIRALNADLERRVQERTAALADETEKLRAVLNTAVDAIITIDERGRIESFNPAAERMFGYAASEVIDRNVSCLMPEPHAGAHDGHLRKYLQTGQAQIIGIGREVEAQRRDGTLFPAELAISEARLGERKLFAGILHDISERKRAEADILGLNAELAGRATELETVNKELEAFSYSVSHDLRAPLRHILGYSEMLIGEVGDTLSVKARRYLNVIGKAASQMSELIDDLLEFSRMGRTAMRESRVELDSLVRSVIANLEMATRGRNIEWNTPPLPRVIGDVAMLRQVFANLLGNAVKYTGRRDRARIEIACAGEENGRMILFVRDNGVGFDMKYADKLFGVFQRLHRSDEFEGTGIGLANVQRIVVRHGGRVWAEAAPDQGATFYFTLRPPASP